MRDRKEIVEFSRHDLEEFLKRMAKLRIMGDLFVGRIVEQEVNWRADDSVSVTTTFQEGTLHDIRANVPSLESPKKKK